MELLKICKSRANMAVMHCVAQLDNIKALNARQARKQKVKFCKVMFGNIDKLLQRYNSLPLFDINADVALDVEGL